MVELKIEDLAEMMGKTKWEVEEMLGKSDVIELNLNERKGHRMNSMKEDDELRIFE